MARPVFVLGKQRSGTTWLGNQLVQHPRITGVVNKPPRGIRESGYFTHLYGRYGDLANSSNYMELVTVLCASNFFQLAGVEKQWLYSLWPTTYADVFRAIMDRLAESRGADVWIEKTPGHTYKADMIARLYPDARFVAIKRDLEAIVPSDIVRISTQQKPDRADDPVWRHREIRRIVAAWTYYAKTIDAFAAANPDRVLVTTYEALRADREPRLRAICDFIGVEFDEKMLGDRYVSNTSFRGGRKREDVLSDAEKRRVRRLRRLFGLMPRGLLGLAHGLKHRRQQNQPLQQRFFADLHLMPEGAPKPID